MNSKNNSANKIFTVPNFLSLVRLLLIPIIVWLYCIKKEYVLTAVILVVSGVTDVVDGFIARHFGLVSNLGKALDPVADKLTQLATLFCLVTRFHLMAIPIVLMFIKETIVGVTGLLVIKKTGIVCGADWHGKLTTVLLYGMIMLHIVWYNINNVASNITIAVCTAMMFLSLCLYVYRNISLIREKSKDKANKAL